MNKILIADMTLCRSHGALSFKERIEAARQLDNLKIDAIEIPKIENVRADTLLVRAIASFVKKSVLSVETGYDKEGIDNAADALSTANRPRMKVSLPVSPVGMEYSCHKKAPKMLEMISELVGYAKEKCADVEFCAVDATRAEDGYLAEAARAAVNAGATMITLCDSEGAMLPDRFGGFVADFIKEAQVPDDICIGVMCRDTNGMAAASAVLAAKNGAAVIKTSVDGDAAPLKTVAGIFKNCGESCGLGCNIKYTQLNRILSQIEWIVSGAKSNTAAVISDAASDGIHLDAKDDISAVSSAVKMLGYDLSEEDESKVYEEFKRVAEKKNVGAKELDAIVASVALQVPPTYKLVSYTINSGNLMAASAQIKLEKSGVEMDGISMGDGPIDASFRTIEQIIGRHYELDDFQIQAVTEGREAMGSAVVKLREGGKVYSGNGISTDILGASIRAYINALNKIVYEEA